MENRVNLYAVAGVAQQWEDEPFDDSKLPASIVPDITIERVAGLFTENSFDLAAGTDWLSKKDVDALRHVQYAIVHRFRLGSYRDESTLKLESGETVYQLAACLRLIRPMRQFAMMIHGTVKPDDRIYVTSFDNPIELMEVPSVQKGFTLRNRDVEELQAVAAKFLAAMSGDYWKFRMPVSLHEPAYFIDKNWKARMSLLCSSIEAIYKSQTHDREHSGSGVVKARISWFLGENTSIYAPGDVPSFMSLQREPTIGDVLDDLYEVRNCIAHGDRVPDRFFLPANSPYGDATQLHILEEAASFIVRTSLLKILKDNLLEHFRGGAESQAYFAAHVSPDRNCRRTKPHKDG